MKLPWPRLTPRVRRSGGRRIGQGLVLAMVASVLIVLAVVHDGSPISDVELNDGGVWVTNGELEMMARLNSQVGELETGILTSATSNEVYQQGPSVQVFDDGGGGSERALRLADPVSGTAESLGLPEQFIAAAGGGTVAVLDRESGEAWLRRADDLEGFDATQPHDAEVSPRSALAVTRLGTALVADRVEGTVTAWQLDDEGAAVQRTVHDFDTEFVDDVVLSAVGETPVALQEGILRIPGEDPVDVTGDNPVLQQVGPEAAHVYVATDQALWRGSLSGGGLEMVSQAGVDGDAAAPVLVAGCVHAAWRDTGAERNYQRVCGDERDGWRIPKLADDAVLVFRANRDVVALNDVTSGNAWVVRADGLTLVDNWDSVNPRSENPQIAEASDEQQDNTRNKPPTAEDDEFGARAGATVILPVTLNDVDPDGDLLTLTGPPTSFGDEVALSVTGDGTQVQARIGPDVTGSVTFDYEISDGRQGHTSEATVSVAIADPAIDEAPAMIEDQTNELTVARGHEASINVVPAWIDPEGDSVVLTSAGNPDDPTADGGEVGFRPDGTIAYRDDGTGTGTTSVPFVVAGGEATTEGALQVTVVPPEKAEPVTVADRFTGPVGSTILLEPLANDTDPLGQQLRVARLDRVEGAGAAQVSPPDSVTGTATFIAENPGTYFLEYIATTREGQASEPTAIRVDVTPRSGNNRSPIATRDVAAVPTDGPVLVDVLANDSDPDGDVMVVQGVAVPPRWSEQVTAALVNKQFVRVEVTGDLPGGEQPEITYQLADGVSSPTEGAIAVAMSTADDNRRPEALPDEATVRAGTIVTVPVLDNDEDPDGDPLAIRQTDLFDPGLETWVKDGEVPIIATGTAIRVQVPDDGTTQMQIGYGVTDPELARDDEILTMHIKPDDPADNQAPEPAPLEARTVSGQEIRVPVDVFGSDPDGDPVVYQGVADPPEYGRITGSGAGWFSYEPFVGAKFTGTDEFKITVADQYGEEAPAAVRIGVAPKAAANQAPAALDDRVVVKPGITLQYPILANDSDPDGDPLILLEEEFAPPDGVAASLVDQFVEFTAPDVDGRTQASQSVRYRVTDGLGVFDAALLTVVADEDAPDHAPLATDDVVSADQMVDKGVGDTVEVDVVANDGDLDGSRDELDLEAVDPDVSAVTADGDLRITLAAESRTVAYRITDATDAFSFGFVYVPGTQSTPPRLNTAAVPVEVIAGETETIALDDVVVVREGRSPSIEQTTRITALNGTASADGEDVLTFRAAKDYSGPASITLGVIDGVDLQDPDSLSAQITIPVTVKPSVNKPPEIRNALVVVYAGADPVAVDLGRLATDVNEDELTFDVSGEAGGVSARVEGTNMLVSAADDAASSEGEIFLEVAADDGTAEPQIGTVEVTVIGVDPDADEDIGPPEPPMELVEITIPDGEVGKSETIDVSGAIAFDPYPEEAKTLTSVSAPGQQAGSTTITITPQQAGDTTVTYALEDGSGDPERAVQGAIVVTVADVPGAPGAPAAVRSGGLNTVQLTWKAPVDNGSPITDYILRWDGGDKHCGAVTQCLVDGLTAGEEYRFTVSAVNGVAKNDGEGPESPRSNPVTPNKVPDPMVAPVVEDQFADRDGQLHLRWAKPNNEGSEITGYEIEVSPGGEVRKPGAGETSMVWGGLTNGTAYTFRARAVNKEGTSETWSPTSEPAAPFTVPDQMPAPELVTTGNDDGDGAGYIEVNWTPVTAPANGHDEVLSYDVRVLKDDAEYADVNIPGAGRGTRAFDVENGSFYTAQVRATNRAGTSEWSTMSEAKVTWDKASAVRGITKVNDCGTSNQCRNGTQNYYAEVTFQQPENTGGFPVEYYKYRTSDGRTGQIPAGGTSGSNVRFNGNGVGDSPDQNQTVWIRAVTEPTGQGLQEGAEASKDNFDPYAKPYRPTLTAAPNGYYDVRFTWSASSKGNGRSPEVSYRGAESGTGRPATGSVDADVPKGGAQACLQGQTTTAAGGSGYTGDVCGRSTLRKITVYFTDAGATHGNCQGPNTSTGRCRYIHFKVEGFKPGQTFTGVQPEPRDYTVSRSFTVNSSGTYDFTEDLWYTGYPDPIEFKLDGVSGFGTP